jgi:RNA polymerase sigma factor (TIGR02999 family)
MSDGADITRILEAAARGDAQVAGQLLPLVYEELRKLAAQRLAQENPGHTLQATALVHEAYLRLVGVPDPQRWNGRGHFFAAAAEAMRRILVEQARSKRRLKRGGVGRVRVDLEDALTAAAPEAVDAADLLALDDALTRLESHDPVAANVAKLRCFAGLTMPLAAEALDLSLRTAERNWTYARTWLHRELSGDGGGGRSGK